MPRHVQAREAPLRGRAPLLAGALALAGVALLLAAAAPAAAADTAPPVIRAFAPGEGTFVNATRIDPSGLARVEVTVQVSDDNSALPPGNTSVAVWSAARGAFENASEYIVQQGITPSHVDIFALFFLEDGAYRLDIAASDEPGNPVARSSTFTVDTHEPVLSVAWPFYVNATTIPLRIDARDTGSGVQAPGIVSYRTACSLIWYAFEVEFVELPGRVVAETSVPACVGTSNYLAVVVSDVAGNAAAVNSQGIRCDLAGPTFDEFEPKSFDRIDTARAYVSVIVRDDASGADPRRIQYRASMDGGITFGPWTSADARSTGRNVYANASFDVTDGATVGLEWRAWDYAGNGPDVSRMEFFYVNGPPFLEFFSPDDGTQIYEFNEVRLMAVTDDPDADTVVVVVSSDIDGILGRAWNPATKDMRGVRLSYGIHNLTVALDDGHGHVVHYVYQVRVIHRPPPDPRPLMFTVILAGLMVWAAYSVYTRPDDEEPPRARAAPKA